MNNKSDIELVKKLMSIEDPLVINIPLNDAIYIVLTREYFHIFNQAKINFCQTPDQVLTHLKQDYPNYYNKVITELEKKYLESL